MRILLVSATELEIPSFLHLKDIDVLITGISIPSVMYHLTKKLFAGNYNYAIQAGIAGSFTSQLVPGEVVLVEKDSFGDIGIEEKGVFKSLFRMNLSDKDGFPFTNEYLINTNDILSGSHLKKVTAVTVNKISDSEIQKQRFVNDFKSDIESMEGAAFHYVCLQQNINFLQVRSISNEVGERDKTKWEMKTAIDNLNQELKKIIDSIQ